MEAITIAENEKFLRQQSKDCYLSRQKFGK